jgi:hypothetical protein
LKEKGTPSGRLAHVADVDHAALQGDVAGDGLGIERQGGAGVGVLVGGGAWEEGVVVDVGEGQPIILDQKDRARVGLGDAPAFEQYPVQQDPDVVVPGQFAGQAAEPGEERESRAAGDIVAATADAGERGADKGPVGGA